jgi:hypothetical protein
MHTCGRNGIRNVINGHGMPCTKCQADAVKRALLREQFRQQLRDSKDTHTRGPQP